MVEDSSFSSKKVDMQTVRFVPFAASRMTEDSQVSPASSGMERFMEAA